MDRRQFLISIAALAVVPSVVFEQNNHRHEKVASYWIAASDSPEWMKRQATVVCDGTNDQEQINSLMNQIMEDGGGSVTMMGGSFYIDEIYLPPCVTDAYISDCKFLGRIGGAI